MKTKPHTIPAAVPRLNRSYLTYPSYLPTCCRPPSFSANYSQGATLGGPLKSRGPLRFSLSHSFLLLNCSPPRLCRPLGVALVFEPKTKGCHLPRKKVATFEKVGNLSFLA